MATTLQYVTKNFASRIKKKKKLMNSIKKKPPKFLNGKGLLILHIRYKNSQ